MIEKLFMLEDKILKQPGLYGMWSMLYLANIIVLCLDSVQGSIRNFNIFTTLLSHIYTSVSGANVIYGNKKPSSLLLIAGPLHQYAFWMLLAFYRGDVYSSSAVGIMNIVHTVVVGVFTLDMVFKTWLISINPNAYLDYVNNKEKTVEEMSVYEVNDDNTDDENKDSEVIDGNI